MSNPPLPPFSFGPAAAGGGSSNPPAFGTAASSSNTGGSIFGSTTSNNLFGSASGSAGSAGPIFGSGFGQSNTPSANGAEKKLTFGTPTDTSKPSFGATGDGNMPKPLFGPMSTTNTSSPDRAQSQSLFTGFTGFGTPAKASSMTSAQAGSTTPAPSFLGGMQSTTPSGPPPSSSTFGASTGTSNIFGAGNKETSSQQQASSNTPVFQFPNSSTSLSTGSTPTTTTLFAQPPKIDSSVQNSGATGGSAQNATTSATTSKPTFSFSPAPTTSSAPSSTPFAGFKNTTTTSAPASGLFGSTPTSTSIEASTSKPGFSFPSLQTTTSSAAPATLATTSTSTAPLFSMPAQTSTTSTSQPATTSTTAGTAPAPMTTASTFQANLSTAGPTPGSRLKNKTMDEILTRWASDLSKYTKEFRTHAETVRDWDQKVSDNMQRITKLYVDTIKSEKEMQAVEWHLSKVEEEQDRLERMLTNYENDIEQLMAKSGVDQSTTELGGPDQEREKTYKLADRLGERLDGMGKDLSNMIEEINAVTAGMSRNGKGDEPITEIVKILNSHLSQLQEIDRGSAALQAKVTAAQKVATQMGYANGFGADNGNNQAAVNDFYKSYIGRR